jgi:hypothetical protein
MLSTKFLPKDFKLLKFRSHPVSVSYDKIMNASLRQLILILMVIVFIGMWRLSALVHRPAHLKIAKEIGSVAQFHEDLAPNPSGSGVVFSQETEKGAGLFFCNATTGKTKLLAEQRERNYDAHRFGMLGWSPDGKLFAYAVFNGAKQEPEVIIGDGASGETTGEMAVDGGITEVAWLSPQSFAFLNYNQDVSVREQNADGKWIESRAYHKVASGTLPFSKNSFTAISINSVAWQRGNEIWALDFETSAFKKIWESDTNTLKSFTYSKETGDFQLVCSDESGWYLIYLNREGAVLEVSRNENRTRYAYLKDEAGLNTFYAKTESDLQPTRVFWQGAVEDHIGPIGDYEGSGKYLYGDYLYFAGDLQNQPTGLWQYNLKNGTSRCLVSGLKQPLDDAQIIMPEGGAITNSLGKPMSYHVWSPTHIVAGKKYPLVLAQTPYVWLQYPQVAAQEGYYFAIVDRPFWSDETIYNWAADVKALYAEMAKNPNVDTNNVYLYGCSWETDFLSQLMSEQSNLWKGAILINPSDLPDVTTLQGTKLFVVDGRDDSGAVERLTKYQDEAATLGVPVTLMLQSGSAHIPRSVATERGRTVQFAKFLADN